MSSNTLIYFVLVISVLYSFKSTAQNPALELEKYTPSNQVLYDKIIALDNEFFTAYNQCDLDKQAQFYSDKIEFFDDRNGLMTSKRAIIEGAEKYICGKVTRELVKESVEVYPINDYGAVQIGYHKFYNNQEPNAVSKPSKFILVWHHTNDQWKIEKVFSMH